MRAVCVELKGAEGELDGLKFDIITVRRSHPIPHKPRALTSPPVETLISQCALSYHHFADIAAITRTLAFFLKPGGALLVVDIVKPASHGDAPLFDEKYSHVVPHTHGMTKEAVQAVFEGAGLGEFTFKPIAPISMHGMDAIMFIAKGVKPSA